MTMTLGCGMGGGVEWNRDGGWRSVEAERGGRLGIRDEQRQHNNREEQSAHTK